jgi:signal transduction histidine kinase/ligand-binding sensor domain-containing protein/DNA-binding response OmpR family regulator
MGLFRFEPATGKTTLFRASPDREGQLKSNIITCVFEDSRQRLWIGGNNGLYLFQRHTNDFKRFAFNPKDPHSLSNNGIKAITEDHNGALWIGTDDGGLCQLAPGAKGFNRFQFAENDPHSISSNRVFAITVENAGRLWVGTEEGLNLLDLENKVFQGVSHNDPRNPYSLNGKSVRSIFIDQQGIYWVGTYQGGVNKYDRNLAFFNLRQSNPFDPKGLSAPVVTAFSEDADGNIYVGTDGGGLNLYNRSTGLFAHPEFTGKGQGKHPAVLALENAGDELWIATFMQGIYVLDKQSGRVRHYPKGEDAKSPASNDIFCLKKDRQGKVWIGTNGNGVNVYDPFTGQFRRFNTDTNLPRNVKVLTDGFIRTIEEDNAGNIWIGSVGAGIVLFNPRLNRFHILNKANSGLAVDVVQTIHVGPSGRVWAGTPAGLCLFNDETQTFTCYSEQDGIANAVIYKILEDDAGKVWMSTNNGISSFDPQSHKFKNYSYYNGLQRSTFSLGAGLKTRDGELFFGGLEGFNYFNPRELNYNVNVPAIVLTDLKVANTSVVPGDHAPIREHISMAREIRLAYKQNFSLSFAVLNYTAPQESRYAYMLEGFDKTWNEVGATRSAVFSNLQPGSYVFRVRASSDDGAWTTGDAIINVYVEPPFYLTTYAYLFYIFAVVVVLWGLRYRGIRRLKKKFASEQQQLQAKQAMEMERLEAERRRELEQVKIKYLTNLSHEFRTPVSLIVGPVEKMIEQEQRTDKLGQLHMVKRNARRLLNLVNQLLDFRKLEEQEIKLDLAEGELVSFIREAVESFTDISERKQIDFSFSSCLDRFYTTFDKDKLERILFNLLSNAFKFTPRGGRVALAIDRDPATGLKITVADTGIGMTPDIQEKIFTRFFQADAVPAILNQGSGIGLSITMEFVKMHGGSVHLESIPGKGSTFSVLLPLEPLPEPAVAPGLPTQDNDAAVPRQLQTANGQAEPPGIAAADKMTVLIIEDNEDFRYYLKDTLKPYYKIVEACDGREGWQKTLSAHPQVIVSDINMPFMDGIQLSQKIKMDKRTQHIPIILLTARTGDADQLKGLQTGASDYLSKPFNFEILNVKIRNLLELNQNLKNTYTRQLKVITPVAEVESEDEKLILNVTRYVEEHINSPRLSVEELSRHLFMSRVSLYNKIVQLTGETPVEFIRSLKLNKAAELLEKSDMKIAQIGYAVGFSTPNYFARAFKAKFNMLPSEFLLLKKRSDN